MSSNKQNKLDYSKISSILMKKGKKNQTTLEPLPITKILLLALLKKHSNASGYDLMQRIISLFKDRIHLQSGAIYPALRELEKLGLITSENPTDGRKRRSYNLTEEGRKELSILGGLIRIRMKSLMNPILELIEND